MRNIRRNCVVSSAARLKKGPEGRSRFRFGVSTDMRNRAVQAFWAMHVEAMNWSGMSVREYAAALLLSPTSLRKWRDRLDDGEVDIDWRAHLHPSARPVAGTSAKRTPPETGLTAPPSDDPSPPRQPLRRFFTDDQKRAIALESDQPGVSVSQVARKHGIVTGLLFRWRAFSAPRRTARAIGIAARDDPVLARDLRDADAGLVALQGNGELLFVGEEAPRACRGDAGSSLGGAVRPVSGGVLLALVPATGRAER